MAEGEEEEGEVSVEALQRQVEENLREASQEEEEFEDVDADPNIGQNEIDPILDS